MTARADLARVQEDLRRLGYRMTPQRETILQVFQELPEGTHLSADALHERLRRADGGISLATTYRTLKLLASVGLLRELELAAGLKQNELAGAQAAPHHHMVCVACTTAIEFEQDTLYQLGLDVAGAYGFRLIDVQYKLHGLCPACQEPGGPK